MKGAQASKLKIPEESIQASIIEYLNLFKFEIQQTSRRGIRCKKCGSKAFGADGVTEGLADLVVRAKHWPAPIWMQIEVKGSDTKISPEQQRLAEAGNTYICYSIDDVIAAIEAFEIKLAVPKEGMCPNNRRKPCSGKCDVGMCARFG